MKTGKAYAFLDHEGTSQELVGLMEKSAQRANFSDTFTFRVLDNFVSAMHSKLPVKIAQAAKDTDAYISVPISRLEELSKIEPKKAGNLKYLIIAQDTEASDSAIARPLGRGMANQVTAGMLGEVLRAFDFRRKAVFYQDSRGRSQLD